MYLVPRMFRDSFLVYNFLNLGYFSHVGVKRRMGSKGRKCVKRKKGKWFLTFFSCHTKSTLPNLYTKNNKNN